MKYQKRLRDEVERVLPEWKEYKNMLQEAAMPAPWLGARGMIATHLFYRVGNSCFVVVGLNHDTPSDLQG
ncbi:hypothetical protein D5086_001754 [Populus alba]|uniref:Uncharacterized protein n=1 Tax=Populus alba TaxID=43335 RepID=A0ACC4D105_POPAL